MDRPQLTSLPGKRYGLCSHDATLTSETSQWWIPSVLAIYFGAAESWNASEDLFLQGDSKTDADVAGEEVDLRGFYLCRLPPRIYITIPRARRAIRSEAF